MYSNKPKTITMIASTDMTGGQHKVIDQVANVPFKFTGSGAGGGFGVLLNKPNAGENGTVAIEGEVEVRVGVAVQAGQWAISAASGFVINCASTTTNHVLGRFMTGAASGMIATLLLQRPIKGATA